MTAQPEVIVHDDAGTLAGDVASRFLARLEEAQARGEDPQVALTGGSIADAIHREIARRAADSSVDWSRVVIWWGDERFVASDSSDRNAGQAREAFLDALPIPAEQIHEIPSSSDTSTAEDAAAAYSSAIRTHGSGDFEIVMLGIGPDGHVASLFPGHPALEVDDRVATAVHDSPKPPPDRVSLTFGALNRAKAVWFVASGEEKAEAVAAALTDGDRHEIPARGVRGAQETLFLLDAESARMHT